MGGMTGSPTVKTCWPGLVCNETEKICDFPDKAGICK